MRSFSAGALALACMSGCSLGVGRKSVQEFRFAQEIPEGDTGFANALYQSVDASMTKGNELTVVDNGEIFAAALAAISKARHSVNIVTFIWSDGRISDRFVEALADRVRNGIQCRVLVDAVGSPSFDRVGRALDLAGCEWHKFRPIPGQDDRARNHRKMVIVDGRTGFTGGFGIDDRWDGEGASDDPPQWRDSNVRARGPVVLAMQQAYAENWLEATGTLLPAADFPEPELAGHSSAGFVSSTEHRVTTRNDRLIQLLISTARKRIWIANAYFVPSTPIAELLARKASAGLDVRILAPGDKSDAKPYLPSQRARMDNLARFGVRAYEYQPAMMHGKTMIVDDRFVLVGSCNLDALSLNMMDEGGLVVDDPALAAEEARRFERDLQVSIERDASRQLRKTAAR